MAVTEADLKKSVAAYRKAEERRKETYDALTEDIRASNVNGLSYDRIAKITDLSKTQVQRICGA